MTGKWRRIRKQALRRDDYTCVRCGYQNPAGKGLTVHHKVPLTKGGRHKLGNTMTVCVRCVKELAHEEARA